MVVLQDQGLQGAPHTLTLLTQTQLTLILLTQITTQITLQLVEEEEGEVVVVGEVVGQGEVRQNLTLTSV